MFAALFKSFLFQIFVVAGQDFEDVRLTFEEWPKHKAGKWSIAAFSETACSFTKTKKKY